MWEGVFTLSVSASHAPSDRAAYTVDQFCEAHSISRSTFYKLRRDGRGPREMEVDGRIRISGEAAAAWRAEMSAVDDLNDDESQIRKNLPVERVARVRRAG
jgi:predicted DNA-binding transcriptional regulator AlpA